MAKNNRKYSAYLDYRTSQREASDAEAKAKQEEQDAENAKKEQIMMQAALLGGDFGSSESAQNMLNTYNNLMAEGANVAREAGFDPESKDYEDFLQYFTYMMWPEDAPVSYDDFYNANSKRLETIKANEMEAQRKASDQKVADFSAAMQQYDPVTGMPLSDMNTQSALDDARQSWNRFSGAIGGAANEAKNNYAAYDQYRKDNNLRWWENADGFAPPNG